MEEKYSIACLQDSNITRGRPHGLPLGLPCYSSISNNCQIVILNTNLQHIQVQKNNHSIFINVTIQEETITIGSQYTPPSADLQEDLHDWSFIKGKSKNFILLGDLNAHSELWGYDNENERGQHLINHLNQHRLMVLNDPTSKPTFETTHLRGWPDVTLASLELFPKILDWSVEDDLHYGDHRLITVELHSTTPRPIKRRFRTKNVSTKKFEKILDEAIKSSNIQFKDIQTPEQFERTYSKFKNIINASCNKSFKKKSTAYNPKITWWSTELRKFRSLVKALYRKSKLIEATNEDIIKYKKFRAIYKKKISEAKKQAWLGFCSKTTDPYGKLKNIAFKNSFTQELSALNTSNTSTHTSQTFYEELTNAIFGHSLKKTTEHSIARNICPPFLSIELKKAIFSFNKNKAPGSDNIDHIVIRSIFKTQENLLLDMYNKLLQLNYFPKDWKIGELVFFKKEGKSETSAHSYRPISLLPIFGKIYEKLLQKRINYQLNNSPKIEANQHGFIEGKSAETAIQEVLSLIDLLSEADNYISLMSIDIKSAFDTLPWDKTLKELKYLQIDENYENIINSFLSERGAFPHWQAKNIHWFNKGCPQGSCFGPFLWRILLNSLLRKLKLKKFLIVAYADDLLVIIFGKSRRQWEKMAEEIMQEISNWIAENQLSISYEKCRVLHMRSPKYFKRKPTLKMDGRTIADENTLQYLGITLDSTLSFLPHLRKKRQEINTLIQDLLRFASAYGGTNKQILKIWYKSILEKKITYAAATWFDRLQKAHGLRLISSIQYQCLLLITRAYKKTATNALCVLTGLPPLHLQLELISSSGKTSRLGKSSGDLDPIMFQCKQKSSQICPYKQYLNILDDNQKEDVGTVQIYTDGSKLEGNTGYAFCVFDQQTKIYEEKTHLQNNNSVYQAELLAIYDAIEWTQKASITSATIYTDSLSGLIALEDIYSKNLLVIQIILKLQHINTKINFKWVKSHIGIRGNEEVDKLAKQATKASADTKIKFWPYPLSHLKRRLKHNLLEAWQLEWDYADTGRYTYRFCPKVNESLILPHRNIYLFATNHGPFASYLYTFNKTQSPYCVCGNLATSLHYITTCTLTSTFHIRKSDNTPDNHWFSVILSEPSFIQKIVDCIRLIENNQCLFENTNPP